MPQHIRKGDQVVVTAGNDKGVTGEVLRVLPREQRVVVKGVNVRNKTIRPTQNNPQGGIIERELPIHMSNVSPVTDGKPTRVRFETDKDGNKSRIAARNDKVLHTLHGPRKKKKSKQTSQA